MFVYDSDYVLHLVKRLGIFLSLSECDGAENDKLYPTYLFVVFMRRHFIYFFSILFLFSVIPTVLPCFEVAVMFHQSPDKQI